MDNEKVIEFGKIIGKLKRTKRTGWKRCKIDEPESIADHSFGAVLLGMVLSDMENIDTEKVIRMLLLHDLQEALTGDINAIEKQKMPDKGKAIERESIIRVLSIFPDDLKEKYLSLWDEMENAKTIEAKFCKDIDKLEMMFQVYDYESLDEKNKDKLEVFWKSDDINIPKRIDSLIKIYDHLKNERNKR